MNDDVDRDDEPCLCGTDFTCLARHDEPPAAPRWADLFGADPDYCDGLPVDEWLARDRGERE